MTTTEAARTLGRRAKGKPKTITPERRAQLVALMGLVNNRRREAKNRCAEGRKALIVAGQ